MVWVNTSPLVKTYTLEEFWELPEPPDHSKVELIAGVLYLTPPPGYKHDNAVSRINRLISDYLSSSGEKGTLFEVRHSIELRVLERERYSIGAPLEVGSHLTSTVLRGLSFDIARVFET